MRAAAETCHAHRVSSDLGGELRGGFCHYNAVAVGEDGSIRNIKIERSGAACANDRTEWVAEIGDSVPLQCSELGVFIYFVRSRLLGILADVCK